MKTLLNSISLFTAVFFSTMSMANTSLAKNTQADTKALQQVIETFRTSLIEKDKAKLSSVFYSDNVPFIAVFSDEMLAEKRKTRPDYPASVDFSKFGSSVTNMIPDKGSREEKIWNVEIDSDGKLASIHFEYSDHLNDKKRAFGTESWDLVKVDNTWKIVSVTFTVTEL